MSSEETQKKKEKNNANVWMKSVHLLHAHARLTCECICEKKKGKKQMCRRIYTLFLSSHTNKTCLTDRFFANELRVNV